MCNLYAIIAECSDGAAVNTVLDAITAGGGVAKIIAPKIGGAKLKNGKVMKADGQLAGTPSVMFDAVALILSDEGCAALMKDAAATQFVMDAFGHLKAIGFTPEAQPLLDKARVQADEGVVGLDDFAKAATQRYWDREPKIRSLA
jgi:catalase